MREFRHPEIDHTFIIKEITLNDILNGETWFIEIDGIKIHKKELDDMVTHANQGGSSFDINDLSLPILQHVIAYKNTL